MGDALLEIQIERLLGDRYPSSVTALEIMRGLGIKREAATKKSINRVLYHRIATKGMVTVQEGTPPCWTATAALLEKLKIGKQAAVAPRTIPPPQGTPNSQTVGPVLGAIPQSRTVGGQQCQPQQVVSYQPPAMPGSGMQSSALTLSSQPQQPTMQVMQTAVGVVQPCNHVHVVPGVLAYSTGGTCYACQAERAAPKQNPTSHGQPLTKSTTTQGVARPSQATCGHPGGNQHPYPHLHQQQPPQNSEYRGQQAVAPTNQFQGGAAGAPHQPSTYGNAHVSVQQQTLLHGGTGHHHQQQPGPINQGMSNPGLGQRGVGMTGGGHYVNNQANSGYHLAYPAATGYQQMGGIPGGAPYQPQPQGYVGQGVGQYGMQMVGGGGGPQGIRPGLSPTQAPGYQLVQPQEGMAYQGVPSGVGHVMTREGNQSGLIAGCHGAVPVGQVVGGVVGGKEVERTAVEGNVSGNGKTGQTLTSVGNVQQQQSIGMEGKNDGGAGQENETNENRGEGGMAERHPPVGGGVLN